MQDLTESISCIKIWVPGEQATEASLLTRREGDDTTPGMLKMYPKVNFRQNALNAADLFFPGQIVTYCRLKYNNFKNRGYGEDRRIFAIKFTICI